MREKNRRVDMKLFTVLSLLAALSSPAVAGIVSSKEAGKAHCTKMQGDHSLVDSSSSSLSKSKTSASVAK
jgi:hypothetical protein